MMTRAAHKTVVAGTKLCRSGLILVVALSLASCGGDGMDDLRAFVNTAFQDERPEIEPLPEMKPFQAYEYSAAELADPFGKANVATSQDQGDQNSELRPDPNRPREPLEAYTLDGLKMVGMLVREDTPWVVMQTSQGTAHYVTVGNYMGQKDGKIKSINIEQQSLVLTETFMNATGRWETKDVELGIDD